MDVTLVAQVQPECVAQARPSGCGQSQRAGIAFAPKPAKDGTAAPDIEIDCVAVRS